MLYIRSVCVGDYLLVNVPLYGWLDSLLDALRGLFVNCSPSLPRWLSRVAYCARWVESVLSINWCPFPLGRCLFLIVVPILGWLTLPSAASINTPRQSSRVVSVYCNISAHRLH